MGSVCGWGLFSCFCRTDVRRQRELWSKWPVVFLPHPAPIWKNEDGWLRWTGKVTVLGVTAPQWFQRSPGYRVTRSSSIRISCESQRANFLQVRFFYLRFGFVVGLILPFPEEMAFLKHWVAFSTCRSFRAQTHFGYLSLRTHPFIYSGWYFTEVCEIPTGPEEKTGSPNSNPSEVLTGVL